MGFVASLATILAFDFVIRIVFYGLVFTFAQHLIYPMGRVHEEVNAIVSAFYAVSSVSSIFVAIYADTAQDGLYKVLKAGTVMYAFSATLLCLGAYSEYAEIAKEVTINRSWLRATNHGPFVLFMFGIFLFALSYGSIKTTITPTIGNLHQLFEKSRSTEESPPYESLWSRKKRSLYHRLSSSFPSSISIDQMFRLYYWLINLGGLIGILLVPMVAEGQIGVHFMSNSTCSVCHHSEEVEGGHSPHTAKFIRSYFEPYLLCAVLSFFALTIMLLYERLKKSRKSAFSSQNLNVKKSINEPVIMESDESFEAADENSTLSVRSFFNYLLSPNILKICCILPVFWLISNQQSSNIILQAHYLQRPHWMASPTMLNSINSIILLIVIPAIECVFLANSRIRGWFTVKRRVVFGTCLSALSMAYAGLLQFCILRCGSFDSHNNYHPYNHKISSFFQVPVYFIQTAAEALTSITVLQLAYTLSPQTKKAFGMALYMFTSFLASILGIVVTPLTKPILIIYLFVACAFIILIESLLFHLYFPEDRG